MAFSFNPITGKLDLVGAALLGVGTQIETSSFTASVGGVYSTAGNGIVVNDPPSSTTGQSYRVYVLSGYAIIGGTLCNPSKAPYTRYYLDSTAGWVNSWSQSQGAVPDRLFNTAKKIYSNQQGFYTTQLRCLLVGDSWATMPTDQLCGAFGFGGMFIAGWNSNYSGGSVTTGDYSATPTGNYVTLGSGGTAIFGNNTNTSGIAGRTVKVYYIAVNGGGSFKVQTDKLAAGTWTDISGSTTSTNNSGTATLQVATFTMSARDFYRVQVVGMSGNSKIVGAAVYENTNNGGGDSQPGAAFMDLSFGGTSMDQWLTAGQTNWTTIVGDFAPQLVTIKADDNLSTWEGYLQTLITTIKTASPLSDIVIVSDHPQYMNWKGNQDRNNYISTIAAKNGCLYIDAVNYLPDYLTAYALGWYNEGSLGSALSYTASGTTLTISETATPRKVGDNITIISSTDSTINGVYTVATKSTNSFTVTVPSFVASSGSLQYGVSGYHLNNYGSQYLQNLVWTHLRPLTLGIMGLGIAQTTSGNKPAHYLPWDVNGVIDFRSAFSKAWNIITGSQQASLLFKTVGNNGYGSGDNYDRIGMGIKAFGTLAGTDYRQNCLEFSDPDATPRIYFGGGQAWFSRFNGSALTRGSYGTVEVMCPDTNGNPALNVGAPTGTGALQVWSKGATQSSTGTQVSQVNNDGTFNIPGLFITAGTNKKAGTFTLISGTKVVSNNSITANSVVVMTLKTASGTVSQAPFVSAITAGTGFTVTGGGSDNSTYNYIIFEVN